MWITNPIALYGWVFISVRLFFSLPPHKAVIASVLGAFLFLPMSSIDIPIPLFPNLTKGSAVAYGILLGEILSGAKAKHPFKLSAYDIPMLVFCFVCPFASSVSNGFGLYNGVFLSINQFFSFGVFYWAGRRYFSSPSSMRALTMAIMIGGLICVPMVLFEVRMSPQLHQSVYGFFQHSWAQMFRQGGFRPILFMNHALMVALWMTATATITFWLWRTTEIEKVWKVSPVIAFCALALSSILCRSSGALFYMALGITAYFIYKKDNSSKPLVALIILIPVYFYLRLSQKLTIDQVESFISPLFKPERVGSLTIRLLQEDLFGAKALLRPLFGWGWMGRAWPVDAETGVRLIPMVDSFWIITLSTTGIVGLLSIYLSLALGPLFILATSGSPRGLARGLDPPFGKDAIVLAIVVALFLLDSLQNGMIAPIYVLCSGALLAYYEKDGAEYGIQPLSSTLSARPSASK